jgi:PPOX class probable F420-dependent enzyme
LSRRAQITMSDDELAAFLAEQRIVNCATIGRDGWPHVMPLWYLLRERTLWVWTYAASQKVRNLERDPRATLLVQAGDAYEELRGVMFETEAVIERDTDLVAALGLAIYERYLDEVTDEVRATITKQAPKRVAIHFNEHARASWDHRKLAP